MHFPLASADHAAAWGGENAKQKSNAVAAVENAFHFDDRSNRFAGKSEPISFVNNVNKNSSANGFTINQNTLNASTRSSGSRRQRAARHGNGHHRRRLNQRFRTEIPQSNGTVCVAMLLITEEIMTRII